MSQANDLLQTLVEDTIVTTDTGNVVIGSDRYLVVPESMKKIGVQYDHNVNTVTFDCPRYFDGRDLSKMKIYVNYMRSDDKPGVSLCENLVVDSANSDLIHFDWVITDNVTAVPGTLAVLVCGVTVGLDGKATRHWNSELNTDMYVSEGMKCRETIIRRHPDIITQLLTRMENAEAEVDPDEVIRKINQALATESSTQVTIKDKVNEYLRTDADLVGTVDTAVEEALGDIGDVVAEAKDLAQDANDIANEASTVAKGKNRARVFLTTEDMHLWLSSESNIGQAQVGDNIYIVALNVPDWWISEVLTERDSSTGYFYKIAQLETQKVDLTTLEEDLGIVGAKADLLEASVNSLRAKDILLEEKDTELQTALNAKPSVFYGTTEPSADLGKDGDLYFMYEEE